MSEKATKNIVLVHGAFVDGSGWEGVYQILKNDGYNVAVVQNPTASLAEDVAVTKRAIQAQDGEVVLVGHSYGGVVITEAGSDPKVTSLVYINAFAPDEGESVAALIQNPPPDAPVAPLLPPQDGFLSLDKSKFHASFAADLDEEKATFMADSQTPWGLEAVNGVVSEPAWKTKPSWFLIAAGDMMVPPVAQRFMAERAGSTIVDAEGSHAILMSQPETVAKLIKEAASGTKAAAN